MSKLKKATFATAALSLLVAVLTLQSCTRDMCEVTMTYTKYTPIYMSYDELRAPDAIKSTAPRTLENPGKIYVKDNLLLVNEYRKGVHLFDNSNPSSPIALGFVSIPGNKDIAVYGDILYADSHIDVVAIDISNPSNPTLINRSENVLPYDDYENYTVLDPSQGVVNEWNEEVVTETTMMDCNSSGNLGPDVLFEGSQAFGGSGGSAGGNKNPMTAGKGGSMARFTIVDRYLYAVSNSEMHIFDIGGGNLAHYANVNMGFGVETIFPYNDMLFVGTTTGMLIYNNVNPANPTYLSTFQHVTSCDPVVVEGTRAYVSLRGGTPCGNNENSVHVVDITVPSNPTLISSVGLTEPFGVGIDNNTLFVCDGDAGLKVFDVNNPSNFQMLTTLSGFKAYDVIPLNNILYMVAENGIYQYDYSNKSSLQMLSRIPVGN